MSEIAIRVENLGKQYRIGRSEGKASYKTLRGAVSEAAAAPLRWLRGDGRAPAERIWALKDVSFEVKKGEVVGVIGRNGAGKSTLLKILSQITEPTTGTVDIFGRVGSLLEVGTGFHPELTGRENIYLNGAILGMKRAEINKRFDEIVDFSEIEKFIDTPVKHYSSGMYLRLAFAVAAHMDPEILLVDEVLAVGDAEFQKKCLGKMGEVAHQGRTVVFVSHNMTAILATCEAAMLLSQGTVAAFGETKALVHNYLASGQESNQILKESPLLRFLGIRNVQQLQDLMPGDDIAIDLAFCSGMQALNSLSVDIAITDPQGNFVFHGRSVQAIKSVHVTAGSAFTYRYVVHSPRLSPGSYCLIVFATELQEPILWIDNIPLCNISNKSDFGILDYFSGFRSPVIPKYTVEVVSGH